MGLIEGLFAILFGSGRNVIGETAEVFRPNAEAQAQRHAGVQMAALAQHGAEFARSPEGFFDRFMNGLNRVPRPALALGTVGLFIAAMVDPIWFSARMTGLALVPDPLWWLLGAIVSFYFGARHQAKGQSHQRDIAALMAQTAPQVVNDVQQIEALRVSKEIIQDPPKSAVVSLSETIDMDENPALRAWQRSKT
jgi:hypothetical protein